MNAKKWTIALSLVACTTQAYATEGTRGGGEFVYRADIPILRDLVDPATCDQAFGRSGDDVYAKIPKLAEVMHSVATLDWYFAFELEREVKSLTYCFTADLVRVNTHDRVEDQVTDPDSAGPTVQGGIRSGRDVFIDKAKFSQMSDISKAMTIIHEALHSYLPWDTARRNFKLRQFTNAIANVYSKDISTRKGLHLEMTDNSILFPLSVDQLEPIKDFFLAVVGGENLRETMIEKNLSKIDQFFEATIPSPIILMGDDVDSIRRIFADRYSALLESVCEAKNEALISKLASSAKTFDPAFICLGDTAVNSDPDFVRFLTSQTTLAPSVERAWTKLTHADVNLLDERIMISAKISQISATPEDSRDFRPIIELLPVYSATSTRLGSEFNGTIEALALAARAGNISEVIALTGGSALFYQAFSVQEMLARITAISNADPKEKILALQALPDVYRSFIQYLLSQIAAIAGNDAATQVKQSIDFSKLGL